MIKPTVLVVEDEAFILLYLSELLEGAGFECIQATNADAAINILSARPDIRVVVTDINIPGSMDGLKLAFAVRERWPPVELIVVSGRYTLSRENLPARARFMPKPLDEAMLIGNLHELTTPPVDYTSTAGPP